MNLDDAKQPYDVEAGERLKAELEVVGMGGEMVRDLETVLEGVEIEARAREAQSERISKALQAEKTRQDQWETIELEKDDVEEDWELI